jgi:hypothetical protein
MCGYQRVDASSHNHFYQDYHNSNHWYCNACAYPGQDGQELQQVSQNQINDNMFIY